MIDFNIVGQNLLTLGILAFFGWVIWQNQKGNNALASFKSKFSKAFTKSKLK